MKKILIFLLLLITPVYASEKAILQSADGNAISASNPLQVTLSGGSGNINFTGNVGIGSVNPTQALDVKGGAVIGVQNSSASLTSNATGSSTTPLGNISSSVYTYAQSFQITSGSTTISGVTIPFSTKTNNPVGKVRVRIETDNAGVPSGTLVDSNAVVDIMPIPNQNNFFHFPANFTVTASTLYWIVIAHQTSQGTNNAWNLKYSNGANPYANGALFFSTNGGAYVAYGAGYDLLFEVDGQGTGTSVEAVFLNKSEGISISDTSPILAINGTAGNVYSLAVSNGIIAGDTTNTSLNYFFNNVNGVAQGSGAAFKASRTLTGDINTHAFEDQSVLNQTTPNADGYAAFDAQPYDIGNTLNHLAGYQSRPYLNSSSGVTNYVANFSIPAGGSLNKQGNVPAWHGIWINDVTNSNGGTVTSDYGVRVSALTAGTNNWGIYIEGTMPSYFGGNVGIGTFTPAPLGSLIVSSGNVGIGTNVPINTLSVVGNAAIGSVGNVGIAAPSNGLYVQGNVGIGSLTPGTSLDVQGTTRALQVRVTSIGSDSGQTDTTVCQDTTNHQLYAGSGTIGICLGTSTKDAKQNIVPISEGIGQIMSLKPVSFNYKEGWGYDTNKLYYGFLAEDVEPILPHLVGHNDKGEIKNADYVGMIPIIVKAMQQMQQEIDSLKQND